MLLSGTNTYLLVSGRVEDWCSQLPDGCLSLTKRSPLGISEHLMWHYDFKMHGETHVFDCPDQSGGIKLRSP